MDKINIALAATEDNAAAIRELNKALVRRCACEVIGGTYGDTTTFGTVTSNGSLGAVVSFSGDSATLKFGDDVLASGQSPLLAVLPAGTKELKLSALRMGATALIIGGC